MVSFLVFTSDQSIYLKAHSLSQLRLYFSKRKPKTQSKWVIGLAFRIFRKVNSLYEVK